MPLLTAEQFRSTFGATRHRIGDDEPPFDFWPYVDGIPAADFEGHNCSGGNVEVAYRMEPGGYEHVLIRSENRNVFMVIVLDRDARTVYGHHLLDLNREYGLDD